MTCHIVFAALGLMNVLCLLVFYIHYLTKKLTALKKETHTNRLILVDNENIIETLTEKLALYEKQTHTNRLIQHGNQIIIETLAKRNETLTEKLALHEKWRVQYTEYMKKKKAHYADTVNRMNAQHTENMKLLLEEYCII
jgi:hypothetical protein